MATDTLYYDGNCPLCKREIDLLKRLSKACIDFVDIHQIKDDSLPSTAALLKELHLNKADGTWLKGLDDNVYLWSKTPYGLLFKPLRRWPLRPLADKIYYAWAERRYQKRYACSSCSPSSH